MDAGLDIGTDRLRAVWGDPGSPSFEEQVPVALPVDESDLMASNRSPEDLLTMEFEGQRYVVGSDAVAVAEAVGRDPESLLETGHLSEKGWNREAFASLVAATLGPLEGPADRLCYTTPGAPIDTTVDTEAHREAVAGVLSNLGYDATPVSEGLAVIYDGLAGENLTGLGIAVRTDTTSVCLAYYGVPVLVFSIAQGAAWVEEKAAETTGQTAETAARRREEFVLDPMADQDDLGNALGKAYDELVETVLDAVVSEAGQGDVREGVSVPIVLGGDGAVAGLEALFGARADGTELPFSITDAMLAADPARATSRGSLAAAADDVDAYEAVT
ncbi:MAG: pilus assembly protein FimV, partial [Halobacteriales archaeon]